MMTHKEKIQNKVEEARALVKGGNSQVAAAKTVGISPVTLAKYLTKRTYKKRSVQQVLSVPENRTPTTNKVMVFYGTPEEIGNLVKELS